MAAESRALRSCIGTLCAVTGTFLCLLEGCLNPVPDEFPAGRGNEVLVPGEVSCIENPYRVDCSGERPNSSDDGSTPGGPPAAEDPTFNGEQIPLEPSNPDAGAPDAGDVAHPDADIQLP